MNHLIIAPLLVPLLTGIGLLLLRGRTFGLQRLLSVVAAVAQIGLACLLVGAVSGGEILVYALGNWPAPFGIVLVADRLAAWMLVITSLLALLALLDACRGSDRDGRHFHVLFQLQLFGLNGAFLTGDIFNLFVFFEVLLLASYGLVLHGGGRKRVLSGLHYVVLNLAGSALFLIAVGTLYGIYGTLNMADLAVRVATTSAENSGPARAAGLLLFAVFALKAALLPLHLWLPAAYAHTSAPVAALFAVMTKVGAYCILRVYTLIFGADAGPLADLLTPWLLPLALSTLAVGMFGALAASGLRMQVAYLVVGSVGTLLTAFSLGSTSAIAAGLYYLPHTTFAAAALFLLADLIARRRGELGERLDPAPPIPQAGLLGGIFFIAAMVAAGLPPLSGFIGKFLILRAALDHEALVWVMGGLLAAGLLAMIALARTGSLLFFRTLPTAADEPPALPAPTLPALLPIAGLLGLTLALSLWAGALQTHTLAIAEQLLKPQSYIGAVLGRAP